MAWKWLRKHRLASPEAETSVAGTLRTAIRLESWRDICHGFWSSSSVRVCLGLAGLLANGARAGHSAGFLSKSASGHDARRKSLAESTAIGVALLADRADTSTLQRYLEAVMKRTGDLVSIEVRDQQGQRLLAVGSEANGLDSEKEGTKVTVPLFAGEKHWGDVEVHFQRLAVGDVRWSWNGPAFRHGAS